MRKKRDYKRNIQPDLKYGSTLIAMLINCLTLAGKKATAEKFVYKALLEIEKILLNSPAAFIETIVNNVIICVELVQKRVGGATYQVPKPLTNQRSISKTIKFLVKMIRSINGKTLNEAVRTVLLDAYNKTGPIYTAYNNLNNAAEANRVNAVYRW
jgi:small subunit ribosomal protein S7